MRSRRLWSVEIFGLKQVSSDFDELISCFSSLCERLKATVFAATCALALTYCLDSMS